MSASCFDRSTLLKWIFGHVADGSLRETGQVLRPGVWRSGWPSGVGKSSEFAKFHLQLKLTPWKVAVWLLIGHSTRTWVWQVRTSTQWKSRDASALVRKGSVSLKME